jgi:hypothetical protein
MPAQKSKWGHVLICRADLHAPTCTCMSSTCRQCVRLCCADSVCIRVCMRVHGFSAGCQYLCSFTTLGSCMQLFGYRACVSAHWCLFETYLLLSRIRDMCVSLPACVCTHVRWLILGVYCLSCRCVCIYCHMRVCFAGLTNKKLKITHTL